MCSCNAFGIAAKTSSRLLVISLVDTDTPTGTPQRVDSVPGRKRRQSVRRLRNIIAAPDHVHVGSQQQQVMLVDVTGALIGNVENLQRGADGGEGALQRAGIGARAAEPQQRVTVAVADAILHRASVPQP